MNSARRFAVAVWVFALAATGISPALQYIRPHAVNATSSRTAYENVYGAPRHNARGRLFLFIPGTWAAPRLYSKIAAQAVANGYHAIVISYPNMTEIRKVCAPKADTNCWESFRFALFSGSPSPYVKITPADSMFGRLVDLLKYLDKRDPSAHWAQFLSGSNPAWSKIWVGGHSQGGADAGLLSKIYSLGGACMIDAPGDINNAGAPAAWFKQPATTPVDRLYAFSNQDDAFLPWQSIQWKLWNVLGLAGPLTNIDKARPPYGNSHMLVTIRRMHSKLRSHDLAVMDQATPRGPGGAPLFAPVWRYACFP